MWAVDACPSTGAAYPSLSSAAISATDRPRAGAPRGRTNPSTISRSSGSISNACAANRENCWRASATACCTARPELYVIALPLLPGDGGAVDELAEITWTASTGTPNVSAAITANPLATPLMSMTPVMTVIVPSGSRRHVAAAGSMVASHTPIASPTPSPAGRSARSCPHRVPAQRVEAFDPADPWPDLSGRRSMPFGHEVRHAELDRIDGQPLGELVHE